MELQSDISERTAANYALQGQRTLVRMQFQPVWAAIDIAYLLISARRVHSRRSYNLYMQCAACSECRLVLSVHQSPVRRSPFAEHARFDFDDTCGHSNVMHDHVR
jgi:hypothetical protein